MDVVKTTLCCVVDPSSEKILMVINKRGWGEGNYNFPGGKLENGETFESNSIRESEEETGIIPIDPKLIGILEFIWLEKDTKVYNEVFYAEKFSGSLKQENDECSALWVPIRDIPLGKMWASDKVWVPEMLAKRPFHFEFTNPKSKEPLCKKLAFNVKDYIES